MPELFIGRLSISTTFEDFVQIVTIDESKAKAYVLVAVFADSHFAPSLRKELRAFLLRGQRSIHFSLENDSRRRKFLSLISRHDLPMRVYVSNETNQATARRWCLEMLLDDLPKEEQFKLVLDRDEAFVSFDQRIITNTSKVNNLNRGNIHGHDEPEYEPLLWIPDAIAWSYAKNGIWRTRVKELASIKIKKQA